MIAPVVKTLLNPKLLAALAWAAVFVAFLYWSDFGRNSRQLMLELYHFLVDDPRGMLLYVFVFCARSIILFPASFLCLLAGSIYGFWLGLLLAWIGKALSAQIAYLMARFVAGDWIADRDWGPLEKWREQLELHAFSAVLALRVLFTPFDLVNLFAGMMAIPWRAYAVATLIGIVPSLAVFASAGASLDLSDPNTLLDGNVANLFDATQLAITAGLLGLSFIVAHWTRRRTRRRMARARAAQDE